MGGLGKGDISDYSDRVLDVDRCFWGLGYELKVWGWERVGRLSGYFDKAWS